VEDEDVRVNDRTEQVPAVFDMAQNIENLWRGSNRDEKRRILEIVGLNRHAGDVSLCLKKTKPFDVLAERHEFVESRGDRI